MVSDARFDPSVIQGEVDTIEGGFTDLSALKQKLKMRGEGERWADLVVIAQAWHWAHPDYDSAIVSAISCSRSYTDCERGVFRKK